MLLFSRGNVTPPVNILRLLMKNHLPLLVTPGRESASHQ